MQFRSELLNKTLIWLVIWLIGLSACQLANATYITVLRCLSSVVTEIRKDESQLGTIVSP
jgi:hypothetical protein